MFRPIRLGHKQLSDAETIAALQQGQYGVFSVFGEDGYPYGVPVQYVWLNDAVYFHCATEGHKLDAIFANPKVCFTVVSDMQILAADFNTAYHSVVIFGKASLVSDQAELEQALWEVFKKYTPDHLESAKKYLADNIAVTNVVKISVDHITGKAKKI